MLTCKAKARLLAHFRHPRALNHAAILLKDYKKNSQERKLRVGNIHLDELVQEIGGERDQLKPFNQPANLSWTDRFVCGENVMATALSSNHRALRAQPWN